MREVFLILDRRAEGAAERLRPGCTGAGESSGGLGPVHCLGNARRFGERLVTKDADGHVRPVVKRTFQSFTQAKVENTQSRIYLGIHWHFDKTAGIAQGRKVADYVFNHAFLPIHGQ